MIDIRTMKNILTVQMDAELRAIRGIIRDYQRKTSSDRSLMQQCDQIFENRLLTNPKALKMSFWKDHFEWQSLVAYPEIKGRILDFGCGSGHSDVFLARQGRQVHGIDLSPLGIRIANYLRDKEGEMIKNRLSFEAVDITTGRPAGELFDSVWASHVFEHIDDPGPLLQGLKKWLKPEAHVLLSVPLGNAYSDPGHIHKYYTDSQLVDFLKNCLQIVRIDVSEKKQVIRALCRFK